MAEEPISVQEFIQHSPDDLSMFITMANQAIKSQGTPASVTFHDMAEKQSIALMHLYQSRGWKVKRYYNSWHWTLRFEVPQSPVGLNAVKQEKV